MQAPNHIIKKFSFELQARGMEHGYGLQKSCVKMVDENLLFEMNTILDRHFPEREIIRINKIEIDLGTVTNESFEKEFTVKYLESFVKSLRAVQNKQAGRETETINQVTAGEDILQQFFYFLKEGKTIWSAQLLDFNDWQQEVIKAAEAMVVSFKKALSRLLKQNATASERLLLQFDDWFLVAIADMFAIEKSGPAAILTGSVPAITSRVRAVIAKRPMAIQNAIERILSSSLSENEPGETAGQQPVLKNAPAAELQKDSPEEIIQQENCIYIDNAGMIILHPFLQKFFTATAVMKEHDFVDAGAKQKAVHLLQYLLNNEEQIPEYKMSLDKILCGLSDEERVNRFVQLSENDKQEAAELLSAVISHWEHLKNTSAPALQETFLQRRGKLTFNKTDQYWKLQVERKSVDILLDKIPWGISYIKLPWMQYPLITEW